MIVFDLVCDHGHRFEGWFRSSSDFAEQKERGLLCCPTCGSVHVIKAPMAPAVPAKGNAATSAPAPSQSGAPAQSGGDLPEKVRHAMAALAKAQAETIKNSTWVGNKFAEESRAMHYGEKAPELIHGRAEPEEAKALLEEGIAVAPLLVPVTPPDEAN